LRAGKLPAAREAADEMLALHASAPEQMTNPQSLLWAGAQTYRALGERERAQALLVQSHPALEAPAAALPDPESRATFLQLPFNRELQDAYAHGIWPDHPH